MLSKFIKDVKEHPPFIVFAICVIILYAVSAVTGFGYISIGNISITFLNIPVIFITILYGLPAGLIAALLFGLSSMFAAGRPGVSPLDALFVNPLLSIVPRLMIPIVVWLVNKGLRRLADDHELSADLICDCFSAQIGVLTNLFFVMGSLLLLYPESIGATDSLSTNTVIISNLFGANLILEIFLAVVIVIFVDLIREKIVKGIKERRLMTAPITRTFNKWLFVITIIAFQILIFFSHLLLSNLDEYNADRLLIQITDSYVKLLNSADDEIDKIDLDNNDLTVGESGFIIIAKDKVITHSANTDLIGKNLSEITVDEESDKYTLPCTIDDIPGVSFSGRTNDAEVISFLPSTEVYRGRNRILLSVMGWLLVHFIITYYFLSSLMKKKVVQSIHKTNEVLKKIEDGNLEEKVDVQGNTEFEELSSGINSMVDALKSTMKEIKEKSQNERQFAREIQLSALPNSEFFQPRDDSYKIWGSIDTAEDVGGDFFDYYLLDDGRLGFVIADVSGKGVPAALFMMTSKTLLKDIVLSGKSPAEAFEIANAELVENNDNGMFVTAWMGIYDSRTGILEFANAGHNPPVLKRRDEAPEFMDYKKYSRSIMLGFMPGTKYTNNQINIGSGDVLLLYTDGVTEARNPSKEMYGEDRLHRFMDRHAKLNPKSLITALREDVRIFADGADQYDDITMVSLKIK